ncbi:hypothetical protein Ae201684P_012011 [Aphanomyces euteiches]|nr:hypothetical protein Ae201684P_012011 [Aphanomyces euteiches]
MQNVVPHASVACLVKKNDDVAPPVDGQLFSTLPADIWTGLPVHINGGFLLLSDLDLPMKGIGASRPHVDSREIWNQILLEDAVIEAYVQLLLTVKHFELPVQYLYACWPRLKESRHTHTACLVAVTYRYEKFKKVFLLINQCTLKLPLFVSCIFRCFDCRSM